MCKWVADPCANCEKLTKTYGGNVENFLKYADSVGEPPWSLIWQISCFDLDTWKRFQWKYPRNRGLEKPLKLRALGEDESRRSRNHDDKYSQSQGCRRSLQHPARKQVVYEVGQEVSFIIRGDIPRYRLLCFRGGETTRRSLKSNKAAQSNIWDYQTLQRPHFTFSHSKMSGL